MLSSRVKFAGGVIQYARTYRAFLHEASRLSDRAYGIKLESVRFIERYQAGWISQQNVVGSAGSLNVRMIPITRMATALTAFQMVFYGIDSILQLRSPALDCRGCLRLDNFKDKNEQ